MNYQLEIKYSENRNYFLDIEFSREPGIDSFYDRVAKFFEMKYLDYYLDDELAAEFDISLEEVEQYSQQCLEVLKAEAFYLEVQAAGLLSG